MKKTRIVVAALCLAFVALVALAGNQNYGGVVFNNGALTFTSLTGDGTGTLDGFMRNIRASTEVAASPHAMTAAQSGLTMTNEGSTAENHHDLPTASAGLHYEFIIVDSDGMQINANTGDVIRVGDGVSASAGFISSTHVGSHVRLVAVNAAEWLAEGENPEEWLVDDTVIGPGAHGDYYFSTPAATANESGTPIKAAGTTTSIDLVGFAHANNRLTYIGQTTRDFTVKLTVSFTAASATTGTIHIATSGSVVTGLNLSEVITNNSELAWSLIGSVTLATNGYVELWVETDDGDDITIQAGTVTVVDAGL